MTARGPAQPGQRMRFRDWFLVGMLAGVVYNLWKNPQGCGCCVGCLGILIIVAAVLVGSVIYAYWPWAVLIIGVALLVRWLHGKDQQRPPR